MPGGTPKTLSPRHRTMAGLVASGLRRGEIAQQLGYAPTSVSHIARSPDFQALVAECQRELSERIIRATLDRLAAQPPSRRGHRS
jgi:DNA-binding NarL/FixJ family response regulator